MNLPVKEKPLLKMSNLYTSFRTNEGVVQAVNGFSLYINYGETVAIVGESGCGKSVTLRSIVRLIPRPPGHVHAKEIRFEGRDLLKLSKREMRQIRGNEIAMIFQEPMTSLNPVFMVGDQISEAIMLHQKLNRRKALDKALEMLRLVEIPDPEKRLYSYPHEMSGGMRQRVMIAMALSCNPKLLLADEPTTALDVTIEAQILDSLRRLREEIGMAIILVTHDLGVVAEIAERMVVLYGGQVVEEGDVAVVFKNSLHPYTEGLLKSIPRVNEDLERLHVIDGSVPDSMAFPKGCKFHPRCPYSSDQCNNIEPTLKQIRNTHFVACHMRN